MYEELFNSFNRTKLESVKKNLEKRDYHVIIIEKKEDVENFIHNNIGTDEVIGLGGSVTLRQLEIDKILKKKGNLVYDHWLEGLNFAQVVEITRHHSSCDCFISSVNALTVQGQLVNIDFLGNRVSAMIFGPKRVLLFVGINKLTETVESALNRIKNIACPLDSKRINLGTPCEKIGYCVHCQHDHAICKITTIIDRKPITIDYTIILLPVELGF
jgi:hypothetical protein